MSFQFSFMKSSFTSILIFLFLTPRKVMIDPIFNICKMLSGDLFLWRWGVTMLSFKHREKECVPLQVLLQEKGWWCRLCEHREAKWHWSPQRITVGMSEEEMLVTKGNASRETVVRGITTCLESPVLCGTDRSIRHHLPFNYQYLVGKTGGKK
jgi:hypothetical protein